ncbi:MAG TPA: hypothetical protein VFE62_08290 [Gemmataceae bacterium]|nr:hypothetical protein [Gemmataceae bacterium]
MAAPTKIAEHSVTLRRYTYYVVGVIVLLGAFVLVWSLRRPPQMGADEEVFRTVDALFTAVTARDEKRLAECERHLTAFKSAGSLPPSAAAHLDGIVRQARGGQWEPAARSLYDFMMAQRRDGRMQKKNVSPGQAS